MNNNQTHNATIAYQAPRRFDIGDVFYRVERVNESQNFREPCKLCGGEQQLTVNGVTFKCPCCNYQKEVITIYKYVVRRYRVYSIKDEVSTLEWKPSTSHNVNIKLYRKVGHGYASTYGDNGGNWKINPKTAKLNPTDIVDTGNNGALDDAIFDDYKIAVSVADKLSERELDRLRAYNAEYGSAHVATFKTDHDPKSN